MPVQQMKKLTTKEIAKLPWAQQQAYHLQHGPQPSEEFQEFTALKQRVGSLLALTAVLGIQFAGTCDCMESVAWAGKAMASVRTATDRIREAAAPADMVKAVKAFKKEIGTESVDNYACNAVQGAVDEIIEFAENAAAGLPEWIAAPELVTKGQAGRAVPTRTGPPIGGGTAAAEREAAAERRGKTTAEAREELKRQEEEANEAVDAAEAALERKEKAIALRKQFEEETAAEEKKLADAKAEAEKAAAEKAAADKKGGKKK